MDKSNKINTAYKNHYNKILITNFTKWERKPTHQLCCGWDESDPIQKIVIF